MIVVLDTNVWLKELALNSDLGSALRFFLKHRPARLALPEVVRLEVQHNLRSLIRDAVDNVTKGNRQLLALFGSMKEIVLPTPAEIDALVSGVFTDLGIEILDVPFSFESARASFMKTIRKDPPSDKTQEFKDGVLWADCLNLLSEDDVLLATGDKAFYANREYGTGPAENLRAELNEKARQLTLVYSIKEVLERVETKIHIDTAWLASIVRERGHSASGSLLSRTGTEVSGEPKVQTDLFATEDPGLVYLTYSIEIPCSDLTGEGRTNLQLSLSGNGTLRLQPREIVDLRAEEESLSFTKPDGTDGRVRSVYMVGNVVFGHRTVEHAVRHRLGSAG